jgi:hypothetical protein
MGRREPTRLLAGSTDGLHEPGTATIAGPAARNLMTETSMRSPTPDTRGSGTSYMVVGTLVAAIGAYLFQLIAGRVLGPTALAPITVLWTIQFLVFTTVFMPMEQLTIRRLNLVREHAAPWALLVSAC